MVLADSKAVLMPGRTLPQHQTAISLVKIMAQDPRVERIRWLDLACGRGQMLTNVQDAIPAKRRAKIRYRGVDVSHEYARETESVAKMLFPQVQVDICELRFFERCLLTDDIFDFITCTNTVHEIDPVSLAETLAAAMCRLDGQGCLFFYDMEELPEPELGAISWDGSEIQRVLNAMLAAAGVPEEAFPDVSIWSHATCKCWHVQLHRAHLRVPNLSEHRQSMVFAGGQVITRILQEKLLSSNTALDSAARYGTENLREGQEVRRLLFNHWAIARCLGEPIRLGTKQLKEAIRCLE